MSVRHQSLTRAPVQWSPRAVTLWPRTSDARRRLVQVLLGALWIVDGVLQLQPFMFGRGFFESVILPATSGNPEVVAGPMRAAAALVAPHLVAWNVAFATLQIAIGIGLLLPATVRPALVASVAWSAVVWWLGEGMGGLFTGAASPLTGAPGAALLYALVGVLAWPRAVPADRAASAASAGLLGERGARLAWAALWLGGALLLLSPVNLSPTAVSMPIITTAEAAHLPLWLGNRIWSLAVALGVHSTPVTLVAAALMAVTGIGVALRRHDRVFIGLAVTLALAIWLFGEGLGGVLSGSATDLNTGPLLLLLALALYRPAPAARD